jgi:hypothetical protein
MNTQTQSFEEMALDEIMLAKANWLGVVCAALVPGFIARRVRDNAKGSLDQLRDFLKHKEAVVKDYPNRSEVWSKGVKIAEFEPRIGEDKKLVLDAYVAGLRVQVGEPVLPVVNN